MPSLKNIIKVTLWNEKTSIRWLLIFAALMLITTLGARELWTQEWRWANISWNMLYSGDYFHPYLAGTPYYDKPILSYWVMIAFSHLMGGISTWSLRLPAALSGMLAIFCTYRIGTMLISKRAGLIAGWMLITSFYFIFWARTANTDMLNVAGIMLATMWYFTWREQPGLLNYTVFFAILAVSALFKGLIAPVTVVLAVLPDLFTNKNWQKHLRWSVLPALIPAVIIYMLPFWASIHFSGGQHYNENGFYEVYRENVLRYFHPFDHEDPIYCYLIYLPVYMLPWAFFFIPALFSLRSRWQQMSAGSRWTVWSTLIIFLFLTFSGSRRNYYVLPLVPFAMLLTADWIASGWDTLAKRWRYAMVTLIAGYSSLFVYYNILEPLYYTDGGLPPFARAVRQEAVAIRPWPAWNIVFLDAESKIDLYLQATKPVVMLDVPSMQREAENRMRRSYKAEDLVKLWPVILRHPPHTIFVSRKLYLDKLQPYFKGYKVVIARPSLGMRFLHLDDSFEPIAFIPEAT